MKTQYILLKLAYFVLCTTFLANLTTPKLYGQFNVLLSDNATVCQNSNSGTISIISPGFESPIYWESSSGINPATGEVLTTRINSTALSITYTNLSQTTQFRPVFPSNNSQTPVFVFVLPNTSVGGNITTANNRVCGLNANSILLTLSGHTGSVLRWESSLNDFATAPTTIANTGTTHTVNNLTQTTYYRAVVQNAGSCTPAYSRSQYIMVQNPTVSNVVVEQQPTCSSPNGLVAIEGMFTDISVNNGQTWRGRGTTDFLYLELPPSTYQIKARTMLGCELTYPTPVVVNQPNNTAPTPTVSSVSAINAGQSATLSGSCSSGTLGWYSAATGGTPIATGNAPYITPTLASTTDYYASCTVGSCESLSRALVRVIVNPVITIVPTIAASRTNICAGQSSTLTLSNCAGTVTWSNGLGAGNTKTVFPASTTYYTATCTVVSSVSTYSMGVNVIPAAAPPVISNAGINAGERATLTATYCDGTVTWYDMFGSPLATGHTYTTPILTANTFYYASCKVGECTNNDRSIGSVIINQVVTPPSLTTSQTTICLGESVTLTATNCTGTVFWNNNLGTGPQKKVTPTTTTDYTAFCVALGTASANSTIKITVTTPPTPTIAGVSVNRGQTATLTATGCGGTVNWLTTPAQIGNSLSVTPIETTTYKATCTVGSCVSAEAEATVTVIELTPTCIANKVRLKFRNDFGGCCVARLKGASIQASNNGTNWTTLYTINVNGTGVWQEFSFANTTAYNQVRFVAGSSGYGELHELEFYNNTSKLQGLAFGTGGKDSNNGYQAIFDGNENGAYWHGPDATAGASNYAGLFLDKCNAPITPTPIVPPTPTPVVTSVCSSMNVKIGNLRETGTVSIAVPSTGNYTIRVSYLSWENPAGVTAMVSVNGAAAKALVLPPSPNNTTIREVTFTQALNALDNTLLFSYRNGFYAVTRVCAESVAPNVRIGFDKESVPVGIYPNPVSSQFFVELNGFDNQQIQLRLINLVGKPVISKTIDITSNKHTELIDTQKIEQGMYLLQVIGVAYKGHFKVFKSK